MIELLSLGLATYYVAMAVTTDLGPGAAFKRWREWVWKKRGFELSAMGDWRRARPVMPGTNVLDPLEVDWIAKGVGCPVCASVYVAALMLVVPDLVVTVLAVAGAAAWLARDR